MQTVFFNNSIQERIVICLGMFDGMHRGHNKIVQTAKDLARQLNAKLAIFTFDDAFLPKIKGDGAIFTLSERLKLFSNVGADFTLIGNTDNGLLDLSGERFLDKLFATCQVQAIVCGTDFTCGKNGQCDVEKLIEAAKKNDVIVKVVEAEFDGFEKISSTRIKKHLQNGEIPQANNLLGFEYFFDGVVQRGYSIGNRLGFPTINTAFSSAKIVLRRGVYKTVTIVDGKYYNSITNYGNAPTFSRSEFMVETHLLNFNRDVYGFDVTVLFVEFLRDIYKFDNVEQLKKQLEKDKRCYD